MDEHRICTEASESCISFASRLRLYTHLLQYEGDLLYAGREWYRIVPSSLQTQSLTDGPLPSDLDFEHYADSACFGLVAWNQGEPLHRVHLDLTSTMPANGGSAPDGQR
ncbi:MAG: hypothetical protein H8E44_04695 [Planctomycetes bacterium]|nr:hypothetical protein [Planctomycetota bacterium]